MLHSNIRYRMKTPITNTRSNVTLQDIADIVGCSRNTVSLAMRDSKRISQEMRKKIHRVARKKGYVPNLAAKNLITRRSGLVGILMGGLQDAVRGNLAELLLDELHTSQYKPILGVNRSLANDRDRSQWMHTFQAMNVEIIVTVGEPVEKLSTWERSIPQVFVANSPDTNLKVDYVALDRYEAAHIGIKHLVDKGHRNILIAAEKDSHFLKGAVKASMSNNVEPTVFSSSQPLQNSFAEKTLKYIIDLHKRPTAVIFPDTPVAVHFLRELPQTDIRCPDDLAVISYDYFPWADILKIPLSTIEQPVNEIASQAVRIILARLEEPDLPLQQILLPHRLAVRAST